MIDLSVILISKNQAWNIARLIESVLREATQVASCEIVLVDSASTDATVDTARRYPVRILRLHPHQHLCPSAGRFVGYRHTSGRLVLFLDGDMELYPGWLAKALAVLERYPDVAAIAGTRIELPLGGGPADKPAWADVDFRQMNERKSTGGAAMFRRRVLEEVGPFNPYLCSDEEPELCIRIRRAGHRIVELGHPIAYEYTSLRSAISTKVARWKRGLYLGSGQTLRYHWGRRSFWQIVRERGYGLIPLAWLAMGAAALLALLWAARPAWLIGWLLATMAFVVTDILRRGSPYRTACSLVERLLIAESTLRGSLRKAIPPESYPGRHDVIFPFPEPQERGGPIFKAPRTPDPQVMVPNS